MKLILHSKGFPYLLMLMMIAAILIIRHIQRRKNFQHNKEQKEKIFYPSAEDVKPRGLKRKVSQLEFSRHARCRMECRNISRYEVEYILQNGKINYGKSNLKNNQCPRYAVEGITPEGQKVRIIFAQCKTETVVVTVIDLERDYVCRCPGDE
ncbi:MAG: DUF4258 domain-containing protein [Chitinophagaceae bacterium]|nr:DUF4258 domain-containing protein [Chitinophagaceae bacterium]